MKIEEKFSLKELTTIKVGGPARFFVRAQSIRELREALEYAHKNSLEIFVISGGSNVVVSDHGFDGLVIKIEIDKFEKIKENDKNVWISVGAGLEWDKLVQKIVESGWWGMENLSSIPGRVGACAAQNSGAYGQEVGGVVDKIKAVEVESGEIKEFSREECDYGYRQSIFNAKLTGRYVVVEVIFKLSKVAVPMIDYPDVKKYFDEKKISNPGVVEIREAISEIRKNKLPDMTVVGNAGSFFKNLVVSPDEYDKFVETIEKNFGVEYRDKALELKEKYSSNDGVKILTAWLIDICGLKGTKIGYVKVYEKQPLVLITEQGKATASEVMQLFKKVRNVVFEKTGIEILPEPKLVGFTKSELDEYFKLN
jgi:UDP-N-acetylmuramate dehydrogenase